MLTKKQLDAAIKYNADEGRVIEDDELATLVAWWQAEKGLRVDGMYGPRTQATIRSLLLADETIPQTWDEFLHYYGTGEQGSIWFERNVIECHKKHDNQLPGAPAGQYVHLHRKCEPRFRRGLAKAMVAAPNYKITRMGSHNFRKRSSGDSMSTHAGAAAIDINAPDNEGKRFPRGTAPEPWSEEWMDYWPKSIPREFVEAMESEGLVWGGRFQSYVDPMHIQAAGRYV